MEEHVKEKILQPLKEAENDLSIQEVTEHQKNPYSRKTTSKYLQILEAENEIEKSRQVGNSKFYKIKIN